MTRGGTSTPSNAPVPSAPGPLAPDAAPSPGTGGYTCGGNAHTARAIGLISDLAHIYPGSQDHPFGPYSGEMPPRPEPPQPEPAA